MHRTKARSEWSCFGKMIQSKLRNLPIKSLPVNTPFARSQLHPAAARCHLIQPRFPSSSAHSPACGQNILLLQSREYFSLRTYQNPSSNFLPNSDIPYTCNERACIQPPATYLRYFHNQKCSVIVISYNSIGEEFSSPPPPPRQILSRDSKWTN